MDQQDLPSEAGGGSSGFTENRGTGNSQIYRVGDIIKINDSVTIYIGRERLIIEKKYSFLLDTIAGMLKVIAAVCLLFIFLVPMLNEIVNLIFNLEKEEPKYLNYFFLIPILLIFASPLLYLLACATFYNSKKDTRRLVIDNSIKAVILEDIIGKSKSEEQYNISVFNSLRVVVSRYNSMSIYLGSPTKDIHILGDAETDDNSKKLELAHKIAEILGVPVIEEM